MLLLDVAADFAKPAGLPVVAVHVHHGLSPNADDWAQHVERFAALKGVACRVLPVQVDRSRPSLEAAAREARHFAFATLLLEGDVLLLGHHADDQAETLLLRLLRGSGLGGLAAMRPARPVAGKAVMLRPWLTLPRQMLLEAARQRELVWIEDESNADASFDRNYLRHAVMPALQSRWPAVAAVLGRTAGRMADADALLNEYLDADLAPLLVWPAAAQSPASADIPAGECAATQDADSCPPAPRPALHTEGLLKHSQPRQRALLRRWLFRLGAPIFHDAWIGQLRDLAASCADAEGVLRVAGWELHRFRSALHAFPALPPTLPARVLVWDLQGELDLGAGCGRLQAGSGGLYLAGLTPGMPVTIRFRQGGETIRLHAGGGRRRLKKILQERDVPPWLRERMPLLYLGEELVAVGDCLADAAHALKNAESADSADGQAGVFLRWIRPV